MLIVDTGPLLAAADSSDRDHAKFPTWSGEPQSDGPSDQTQWTVETVDGGCPVLAPGAHRQALRQAIQDCVGTLSPAGHQLVLSTYWIDRMLLNIEVRRGEVGHGNLWVFTRSHDVLEVRMDVDEPQSTPHDMVPIQDMFVGLELLRSEVLERIANGRRLDPKRSWLQRNP